MNLNFENHICNFYFLISIWAWEVNNIVIFFIVLRRHKLNIVNLSPVRKSDLATYLVSFLLILIGELNHLDIQIRHYISYKKTSSPTGSHSFVDTCKYGAYYRGLIEQSRKRSFNFSKQNRENELNDTSNK